MIKEIYRQLFMLSMGYAMRYCSIYIVPMLLSLALPVFAADIAGLAECTTKVFNEINKTHKWSGKPPAGCSARVRVEKRPAGAFVTAWAFETVAGGWVRTAFSAAMDYPEIAGKKALATAISDIMTRARHLGRCLESINTVNDPLDCRYHANKSYLVGEETGTEMERLVWLDDQGRHTVVEYSFGDTSATPSPPVDLFGGEPLPPGLIIDLHLRDNQ